MQPGYFMGQQYGNQPGLPQAPQAGAGGQNDFMKQIAAMMAAANDPNVQMQQRRLAQMQALRDTPMPEGANASANFSDGRTVNYYQKPNPLKQGLAVAQRLGGQVGMPGAEKELATSQEAMLQKYLQAVLGGMGGMGGV